MTYADSFEYKYLLHVSTAEVSTQFGCIISQNAHSYPPNLLPLQGENPHLSQGLPHPYSGPMHPICQQPPMMPEQLQLWQQQYAASVAIYSMPPSQPVIPPPSTAMAAVLPSISSNTAFFPPTIPSTHTAPSSDLSHPVPITSEPSTPSHTGRGCKRKGKGKKGQSMLKQQHINSTATPDAASSTSGDVVIPLVLGIGPSTLPSHPRQSAITNGRETLTAENNSLTAATDVWFFVRPLAEHKKPDN